MSKRALVLSVALCLSAAAVFAGDGTIHRAGEAIKGRYIAILERQFPATQHSDALAAAAGARRMYVYDAVLNGFSFAGSEQAALALSHNPMVASVWEDGAMYGGDTEYNPPPALDRIDQISLPLNGMFNYNASDGAGVRAYIVDTGVNNVSDIAGRLVESLNFVTGEFSAADCSGHGTAVATIVGGTTYGVAKAVQISNLRVLPCGHSGSWSDFINAFNYIASQKQGNPSQLMVANASIWDANSGTYAPAETAVQDCVTAGVAVALIAGNGNGDDAVNHSPGRIGASTPGAITTGATRPADDYVTSYSSQGSVIDIFAPSDTYAMWNDGTQRYFDGTSAAAPHVCGVMARHLSWNPTYTPSDIEAFVKANSHTGVLGRTLGSPDLLLYDGVVRRRICCIY